MILVLHEPSVILRYLRHAKRRRTGGEDVARGVLEAWSPSGPPRQGASSTPLTRAKIFWQLDSDVIEVGMPS